MFFFLTFISPSTPKYEVKFLSKRPTGKFLQYSKPNFSVFRHNLPYDCYIDASPRSPRNISLPDMITRLKRTYSHQCDDFSISPFGSYRLCHFTSFGFQSENQESDYITHSIYSSLDGITAEGGEIVTEWKSDNNGQMIVLRYKCDLLANRGFIASVRENEKCFFINFSTRLVCPFGNNRENVESIVCHLRNEERTF
jgi:hypothetical protein